MPPSGRPKLASELSRIREDKEFRIFPTEAQLTTEDSIRWAGDLAGFLGFARQAGVKTIYLSEWEPDAAAGGREPEGDLEAGFLLDGRMHVYSTVEYAAEGEATQGSTPISSYLTEHRGEVVKSIATDLLSQPEAGWSTMAAASNLLRRHLSQELGADAGDSAIGIRTLEGDSSPLGQLIREVTSEVVKEVRERERPTVELLYPKWLEFARQIGYHVLGKGDLEVFLERQKTTLTRDGRQELWTRAKVDLRAERTADKLQRAHSKV